MRTFYRLMGIVLVSAFGSGCSHTMSHSGPSGTDQSSHWRTPISSNFSQVNDKASGPGSMCRIERRNEPDGDQQCAEMMKPIEPRTACQTYFNWFGGMTVVCPRQTSMPVTGFPQTIPSPQPVLPPILPNSARVASPMPIFMPVSSPMPVQPPFSVPPGAQMPPSVAPPFMPPPASGPVPGVP